jgi:hypothetical protein
MSHRGGIVYFQRVCTIASQLVLIAKLERLDFDFLDLSLDRDHPKSLGHSQEIVKMNREISSSALLFFRNGTEGAGMPHSY